jgi:hypothetical protein
MSRDFELLQRLESGWEQSLHPLPGIEDDPIARTRAALAGSVSTKLYAHATRPLKQVTGEIRNEIQKLVFRAFLSSDACRTVTRLYAFQAISGLFRRANLRAIRLIRPSATFVRC